MTAPSDFVLEVDSLAKLYPNDLNDSNLSRVKLLVTKFQQLYGKMPAFIARSPGRVNLIGEHIDYSDYSVLPMALSDKDILIAVAVDDAVAGPKAVIKAANTDSQKFGSRSINVDVDAEYFPIDKTKHEWSHYFMSGVKGVLKELNIRAVKNMECLVDGNIPTGAGVSSSSAFVCCSALATMKAYNGSLTKTQLTQVAIVSERFVGVESGGMDQSASVFGMWKSALIIHFYPSLSVDYVPFPRGSEDISFVIAHTLVTADKHVTAPIHYNLRVTETRLASLFLAKLFSLNNWEQCLTLRKFHEDYVSKSELFQNASSVEDRTIKSLEEMLKVIESAFEKKDGYTLNEIASCLSIEGGEEALTKKYITLTVKAEKFQLYRRCKHVFSEALRVYQFKMLCCTPTDNVFKKLGQLMNESQESCAELFDCSCPELNELTSLALKHGAYGSRLTGAGWGGCTISLVPKNLLEPFMTSIKAEYYDKKGKEPFMFTTVPGNGAILCNKVE
jgi:galactokinase